MDPLGLLTLIGKAAEAVSRLIETARKLKDAELQNALAQLKFDLAEVRAQAAEAMEERTRLKTELEAVKKSQEVRKALSFRADKYFMREPVEGYDEGPYCARCFDKDGALIHLRKRGPFEWWCPVCIFPVGGDEGGPPLMGGTIQR